MGNYREGQEDMSSIPDWKFYGFMNEHEYGCYLDFNSKSDEDVYDNFKDFE